MSSISSTKVARLLKTWQEQELKDFETWLQSPWCNTNRNLIQLFQQLKKYHPEFNSKWLTKEKLFQKVLPDGKFSHRRMNNLLSECYLAAEKFMVFQRFSQDQNLQKSLLLQELQSRYLDDWFFKAADKELERIEEKAIKDWEDHLDIFHLYRHIYHHPNLGPRMQAGHRTIRRMGEQLELAYLLEKAAIINEKILRNRVYRNEKHEVDDEIKDWLSASQGLTHPVLPLYRMRFAYTKENMPAQYEALYEAFISSFESLNEKEQKTHLRSLINDAMRLIRRGQLDITDALPLYQLGLKTKVLFHLGQLTRNTYITIVGASNTKGDFEFTSYFIEKYTAYLDEKIQDDCALWAWAHTAYWQNKLQTCLGILRQHHFKNLSFRYITKLLHTQVYFDLYLQDHSYQLYLFNYFDTYEKWLHREKVWSEANKESFLRFLQKCRALARAFAELNFDEQKVEQLLDNETNIQALNWLKQKQREVIRSRIG